MSTNPYPQYFEGPTRRGYKRMRVGGPPEAAIGLALIYAAIGASLGIVSGTALAVQVFPANTAVASSNLAQASASMTGLNGPLTSMAEPVPLAQSLPAASASPMASTARAASPIESRETRKSITVRAQHVAHKLNVNMELASLGNETFTRSTHETPAAPIAPASSELHSSVEVAKAPVAVAIPAFMIEGDATVADYDATTGLVETHEGKSFSIGTAVSASNVTSWQDYAGHVHYRCDPGGNCRLSRAGVVVPNARMAT
jgi:hypothetical protein